MHLRHIRERTRSVLSGIPTRSVGTISVRAGICTRSFLCSALIVIHKSASALIVPIAPRGHASRDALRQKWHRLRSQLAGRMTWITLELGLASAPHSRADAERPERHSHAERRNDQCEGWHLYPIVSMLRAHRYTQVRLSTDRAHRSAWACRP